MDIQDGFIVGIFNYCDHWCAACAFTSRCRSFAMEAELEARLDPSHRALADAPPRPEDVCEPPEWLLEAMADAEAALARGELPQDRPRPSQDAHKQLERRARDYAREARDWLDARNLRGATDPGDPAAIIAWFVHYIPSKIGRATFGIANDDGDCKEWPADHDGSAKAAIVGIERSQAAWAALITSRAVSAEEAAPFVSALDWLERELDRVFPRARTFVRPGFDEPEAVAHLEASEQ
jgi:hypothetical protein